MLFSTVAKAYVAYVLIISLVAFCFYGWDKRQAKHDGWRVPELRLHWLSWIGGWPGALMGQQFFRHKTQKFGFRVSTWASGLLHSAGLAALGYWWFK